MISWAGTSLETSYERGAFQPLCTVTRAARGSPSADWRGRLRISIWHLVVQKARKRVRDVIADIQ